MAEVLVCVKAGAAGDDRTGHHRRRSRHRRDDDRVDDEPARGVRGRARDPDRRCDRWVRDGAHPRWRRVGRPAPRRAVGRGHGRGPHRGRPGCLWAGRRGPGHRRRGSGEGGHGAPYDVVLLGNDAADTGDFQVGVRVAYALDWPVVAGCSTVAVDGSVASCVADGPDGTGVFEVALPVVATVLEGGVEPRYPSLMGRMKAKKVAIETVVPGFTPVGSGRSGWRCRRRSPTRSRSSARVRRRPRRSWPCSRSWGGALMALVYVEVDGSELSDVSLEALTVGRGLDGPLRGGRRRVGARRRGRRLREFGVATVRVAQSASLDRYAAAGYAAAVVSALSSSGQPCSSGPARRGRPRSRPTWPLGSTPLWQPMSSRCSRSVSVRR